jgi:AmmeMemoRadiSam system protein A
MDPLVDLARRAVEAAARSRHALDSVPEDLAGRFDDLPRACFVSLHDEDGALRGCIGTLEPCCATLGREILQNACSAALKDRRFTPLTAAELAGLQVKVDVLGPLEPIAGPEFLDPRRYGVVVSVRDGRRGVLLPDLDGVERVEQQLDIARRKAGIGPEERVQLQRFTVERHS